jgi:hypothetical protein
MDGVLGVEIGFVAGDEGFEGGGVFIGEDEGFGAAGLAFGGGGSVGEGSVGARGIDSLLRGGFIR